MRVYDIYVWRSWTRTGYGKIQVIILSTYLIFWNLSNFSSLNNLFLDSLSTLRSEGRGGVVYPTDGMLRSVRSSRSPSVDFLNCTKGISTLHVLNHRLLVNFSDFCPRPWLRRVNRILVPLDETLPGEREREITTTVHLLICVNYICWTTQTSIHRYFGISVSYDIWVSCGGFQRKVGE